MREPGDLGLPQTLTGRRHRGDWMRWWVAPVLFLIVGAAAALYGFQPREWRGRPEAKLVVILFAVVAVPLTPAALVALWRGRHDVWLRSVWFLRSRPAAEAPRWQRDFPWPPDGMIREAASRVLRLEPKTIVLVVALTAAVVSLSEDQKLVTLVCVVPVVWASAHLFLRATSGASRVTWPEMPCRMGTPLRLRFGLEPGASSLVCARYELRCFVEIPRDDLWRPFASAWSVAHYELAPVPDDHLPSPGGDVELVFDVPDDAPSSKLSGGQRVIWQLRVDAETHTGPFDESFLVPVYSA